MILKRMQNGTFESTVRTLANDADSALDVAAYNKISSLGKGTTYEGENPFQADTYTTERVIANEVDRLKADIVAEAQNLAFKRETHIQNETGAAIAKIEASALHSVISVVLTDEERKTTPLTIEFNLDLPNRTVAIGDTAASEIQDWPIDVRGVGVRSITLTRNQTYLNDATRNHPFFDGNRGAVISWTELPTEPGIITFEALCLAGKATSFRNINVTLDVKTQIMSPQGAVRAAANKVLEHYQ